MINRFAQKTLETNLTCAGMVVCVMEPLGGAPGAIVNVAGADGRELTPEDIADVRSQIAYVDCKEVRSWVATEGMSWLSDGMQSVSFEVREVTR